MLVTLYEIENDQVYLDKCKLLSEKVWELFYNEENNFLQKNIIKENDLFIEPIDISDIVSETIINLPKIYHINFSQIIKDNENFYQNYENIWADDSVHLNDKNFDIFIKQIMKKIN